MNPSHTVRRFTPGDIVQDSYLRHLHRVSHYADNGEPQVIDLRHGTQTSMPEHTLTLMCAADQAPEHAVLIDAEDVKPGMTLLHLGGTERVWIVEPTGETGIDLLVGDPPVEEETQGEGPIAYGFRRTAQVAVTAASDGTPLLSPEHTDDIPAAELREGMSALVDGNFRLITWVETEDGQTGLSYEVPITDDVVIVLRARMADESVTVATDADGTPLIEGGAS